MLRYAYWDASDAAPPRQAELVAAWHRHCVAHGHTPRLLTARDAYRSRRYRAGTPPEDLPALALSACRGKVLTPLTLFAESL